MAGPAAEVLANLRGKLEGFQEHLPLIKALRNPGLRDRHWDKISQSKPCRTLVWPLSACWLMFRLLGTILEDAHHSMACMSLSGRSKKIVLFNGRVMPQHGTHALFTERQK